VEHVLNSSGVQVNGEHAVSQPHAGRPSGGRSGAYRARLAVVENEFASVTVSLDTAGHSPRLHVRDNETGDDILLSAIELASLCLATSDDRAGWLKVGLYRTDGEPRAYPAEGALAGGEAAPSDRDEVAPPDRDEAR
jgi:hypothetical protein